MPDLTIEVMQQCRSHRDTIKVPASKGRTWHVRLDGHYGAYCNCPDYARGSKRDRFYECKHIRKVGEHACLWHEQFGPEPANAMGACPRCGGRTDYVQVAV